MNIFIQMDLSVCQFYMMVLFKQFYFIFPLEWSAALTVASVCMSIISMLNSAKKKVILNLLVALGFIII